MSDDVEYFVVKEAASFDMNGEPVFLMPGDIVAAGHPVIRGREYLFKPMVPKYDMPRPEQVREVASPHKPGTQGARSR